MKRNTLTKSLFYRIAPTIMVTIVVIGLIAFKGSTREINHVYDAQLISSANMLWLVVEDEMRASTDRIRRIRKIDLSISNQKELNEFAAAYADSRMFRVWQGNKLAMISDKAPTVGIPQQESGLSYVADDDGNRWRVYSLNIPGTRITVEAGEKVSLRRNLVRNILLSIGAPLVLLIPVVGWLLWAGISSGLGTLRALIAQIGRRSSDDLSPLILEGVPHDLVPLGESINQLLQKLDYSFATERRFTENAAHHLRTPLATLKLQLQLLEQARDEAEYNASMTDLKASMERASRLVGQLLTSTRISHQPITLKAIDFKQALISILSELSPLAAQKRICLALEATEECAVMADDTLLRLLLGNIIENAIKYTPETGNVTVTIEAIENKVRCVVTDTGPGIPEAEREHVFERFYRVGTPKVQGTGLGLAIVAETAARLAGEVKLLTPAAGHGLQVEISLPRATVETNE